MNFKEGEEANAITQMSRKRIGFPTESEVKMIDGIECSFDINTAEEQQETRFTVDNVEPFLNEALELETLLQGEMLS